MRWREVSMVEAMAFARFREEGEDGADQCPGENPPFDPNECAVVVFPDGTAVAARSRWDGMNGEVEEDLPPEFYVYD